jgi:[ribosomal protein S5]-alanine N-acetyltransferase
MGGQIMLQPLVSKRLRLRAFTEKDSPRVQELANNQELADLIGLPYPYKLEYAKSWISSQPALVEQEIEFPFAITIIESDEPIGTITIRVDKTNKRGELGYWMGRAYWGRGYATEAVKRLLTFGFEDLNLNKMWALAISRNTASISVLQKAGLQKEGTLSQHKFLLNRFEDVEVFGLLKEDYEKGNY